MKYAILGAFYAWNYDELYKLLPEKHADIFCFYYQCKKNGNVDPMQVRQTIILFFFY